MIPLLIALGKTLLVLAGLLLPGAGWAHAGRWPLPWFAAGVISALAIFAGVVGSAILGISITLATLTIWLAAIALTGGMVWRRQREPRDAKPVVWREGWLALPALPMLVVAVIRTAGEPLAGADNVFRWDHLARLIVQTGSLDFYPAHTTAGFASYFWADGIAPLVSSLYAWTYLAARELDEHWTAIPVLLQAAGLCALVPALARLWGGARAGWFALGLAGATMLLQFAFFLGQETGLTALGAGGMVFYLTHWQRTRAAHHLIPAAACAALVAVAREYGVAFLFVGLGWLVACRLRWTQLLAFALGGGSLPAIWHGRNWILTGNPLYAQSVGGLFPTNSVFDAWMRGYVEIYGNVLLHASGWRELARLLLISAVPALGGFGAGMVLWRREPAAKGWIVAGGLAALLSAASAPFTAGGIFYALRVTSPLLLLGCAWGGAVLDRWIPGRRYLGGVWLALMLFGCDAALRAWTVPLNPYSIAPREWPDAGYRVQLDFARDDQEFLEGIARRVPGKVLSDSAGVQALFRGHGKTLSPFWSPDVAFLFSRDFDGDAVTRLRELGYSHLLLKRSDYTVQFLKRLGALPRLDGRITGVAANENYLLFSLETPPAAAPR